jgi:predicted house-cleaning NTP pyrophosphatase (Maf/HAM1 superfamily)
VVFRTLTTAEIERYLEREQPYDCAGSFKAEGLGIALFKALRSDDPTALVGLPLIQLRALLAEFGVDVIAGR